MSQATATEVCLNFLLILLVALTGTVRLVEFNCETGQSQVHLAAVIPLIAGCWLLVALGDTKRSPFDCPEAEAELVSGYNVDYASLWFALWLLGEYNSIALIGF